VGGNTSSSSNSGMLITPPPKIGTASQPQIQPVQPVQRPVQTAPVQSVPEQPVQTVNGKIIYNRQYGNIPKGAIPVAVPIP
jgi:lipoprotein NlpD